MRLPIEEVVIHQGKVRCKVRFSYGVPTHFPFTLVHVRSGGLVGLGEGLGELAQSVEGHARKLIGEDARGLDAILPDHTATEGNTAREALSMALHDLVAKAAGVPLCVLLGGAARKRVPLMPAIFPEGPDDAARKARAFAREGYRWMKFKMMGDAKEDLTNLRAIRKEAGRGVTLQGDANRGYKDFGELAGLLGQFEKAGLNVFEDP
ncbi:MAG: mandelate racemase/muconate lactonizing enzyme family protein, partial [Planctomycetota bacterium]